jgi:hypothetical protein
MLTTWFVEARASTTAAQPDGGFVTGVLGKWQYIPEPRAFLAVDQIQANGDAGVWLRKPFLAPIPEPKTMLLLAVCRQHRPAVHRSAEPAVLNHLGAGCRPRRPAQIFIGPMYSEPQARPVM